MTSPLPSSGRGSPPLARLQRDFTAEAPNQVWVTDVTAIWTLTGWVYLAAILDLFARRVVGWTMSENNDTTLALAALQRTVASRQPAPGVMHHSDRGSPYGSDEYIQALDAMGAVRSMSRKGDRGDNVVAESFFATLEHDCLQGRTPATFIDAHRLVGGYIDGFYNPRATALDHGSRQPRLVRIAFRSPSGSGMSSPSVRRGEIPAELVPVVVDAVLRVRRVVLRRDGVELAQGVRV